MKESTRHVCTQGVVLRYTNFKEADRMLTLFSPDRGKISVLARGCRKQNSRLLSATELFTYGEYTLFKRGDFHIMTGANIHDSFYEIRNDLDKLIYGSYILDLTKEVVNPEQEDSHLFFMLLQSLSYLCYSALNPEDLVHVFEIKLMDYLGYRPILDACIICGRKLESVPGPKGSISFDVRQGGLICRSCPRGEGKVYNINLGTIKTMEFILDMDLKGLNILKIPSAINKELDKILWAYTEERLGKRLKTRQFIEDFYRKMEINSRNN
ncbi:MAG TPA: DNA repair protein RecO [Clostridia bacterium]|nr:DNA repair protein RecO [Clostridia bacterium]